MNSQQTKYVEEQAALDQLGSEIHAAYKTAQNTMPFAACELAEALVDGLKVCNMSEDQAFLYKKFNLRIRTMVALGIAYRWAYSEYERHTEMAPQGDE